MDFVRSLLLSSLLSKKLGFLTDSASSGMKLGVSGASIEGRFSSRRVVWEVGTFSTDYTTHTLVGLPICNDNSLTTVNMTKTSKLS